MIRNGIAVSPRIILPSLEKSTDDRGWRPSRNA
jgi:hypothetical protein